MNERRTSTEPSHATLAFAGDHAPLRFCRSRQSRARRGLGLMLGLAVGVAAGATGSSALAADTVVAATEGADQGSLLDTRANADQRPDNYRPEQRRGPLNHVDVAISTGYGFGRSAHPDFKERTLSGVMVNIDIALVFRQKLALGLFVSFLEMPVVRTSGGGYESTGGFDNQVDDGGLRFRTEDSEAGGRDERGGRIIAPSVHNFLAGARLEFTPRGQSGLFMGVAAGMGRVDVSEARFGGALDVRTGYRQFLGDALGLSLGIGVQGQLGANTQSILPYASAELRFRFRTDPKNFDTWRRQRELH